MQGVRVFQASGVALDGTGEFIGDAGPAEGRRLCAPGDGTGGRLAAVLSWFLPAAARAEGIALGHFLAGTRVPDFFWLPLLGCIGIIVSMLSDPHSRQILRKALRRCAVVALAALIVGAAVFLNTPLLELVILAIAPWICFLVLLWGFIQSALSDWDRPS